MFFFFNNILNISFGVTQIIILVFILLLLIFFSTTIIDIKKNGINVIATIKSINAINYPEDEGISSTDYIIMCDVDYENVSDVRLYYNYKLNPKHLKIGDTINCIYVKKKNYLTTKDNYNAVFLMLIIMVLVVIGFILYFFR